MIKFRSPSFRPRCGLADWGLRIDSHLRIADVPSPKTLSRRSLLGSAVACLAGAGFAGQSAAAPHPAAKYMQGVAAELIRAQKKGSISAFRKVLQRHADIDSIALYSLGRYKPNLQNSKRSAYYRGVREFMARYFADQSRKYRVKKAVIHEKVRTDSSGHFLVGSTVTLTSGTSYNVTWQISHQRGRYKVNDVTVLGFSMTFLQRGIFYRYLSKRNGDVNALIAALNR